MFLTFCIFYPWLFCLNFRYHELITHWGGMVQIAIYCTFELQYTLLLSCNILYFWAAIYFTISNYSCFSIDIFELFSTIIISNNTQNPIDLMSPKIKYVKFSSVSFRFILCPLLVYVYKETLRRFGMKLIRVIIRLSSCLFKGCCWSN